MGMEYGPFGLATLILQGWGDFTSAWGAAGGGERLLWLLLLSTVPSAAYAVWFVTARRGGRAFG
jgi:hypothetical protein